MKAATKSSTPSSTDGAVGRCKEPANNRERVQPTKSNKRKEANLIQSVEQRVYLVIQQSKTALDQKTKIQMMNVVTKMRC